MNWGKSSVKTLGQEISLPSESFIPPKGSQITLSPIISIPDLISFKFYNSIYSYHPFGFISISHTLGLLTTTYFDFERFILFLSLATGLIDGIGLNFGEISGNKSDLKKLFTLNIWKTCENVLLPLKIVYYYPTNMEFQLNLFFLVHKLFVFLCPQ